MTFLLMALLLGTAGLRAQEVSTAAPAAVAVAKSRVRVPKGAADWEPVSVKAADGAKAAKTFFERRIRRVKGAYKGERSLAQAAARLYPFKGGNWLVISLSPDSLRERRTHLEASFLIKEGSLREVKVAAVALSEKGGSAGEDSFALRRKGIAFEEVSPGSAEVRLSVLDDQPGARTLNAGSVHLAAFGDKKLGFVSFGWSVTGLKAAR
jgi:hypothetical protein